MFKQIVEIKHLIASGVSGTEEVGSGTGSGPQILPINSLEEFTNLCEWLKVSENKSLLVSN